MPVNVMLSQLTSTEITELRAYHELLREDSQRKQGDDEMPQQTQAEVEATAKILLSKPHK
jgi:hypothetical protein